MKVKDKVVGHWDDADRKVEAEYDGSYMEAQLVLNMLFTKTSTSVRAIVMQAEGDGTEEQTMSDDYYFLDHVHQLGFYAGVVYHS